MSVGVVRGLGCVTAVLALAVLTSAFSLDLQIANAWSDYHYGPVDRRMMQINLPARHGAAMLFLSNRDDRLVGLEDHVANWHFDDIGYLLFAQLFVLGYGVLSAMDLAWWHNAAFVLAAVGLATVVGIGRRSVGLGVLVMALLLALHYRLRPHIYSSVSQHTLITVLALAMVAAIALLALALASRRSAVALAVATAVGVITGATDLVRHPVGLASMVAVATTIVLARRHSRKLLQPLVAAAVGYVMISVGLPAASAIHRDLELGWYRGLSSAYITPPPGHRPYFTLLAAIGRYPNSLGLKYHDGMVDQFLIRRHGGRDYEIVFDRLARQEVLAFVRTRPLEYLWTIVRGAGELPLVIPAVTFNRERIWPGTPRIPPGVDSAVDPHDHQTAEPSRLHNLRLRYLRLAWFEWAVYLAAVAAVGGGVVVGACRTAATPEVPVAFLGALTFTAVLAVPRALIPVHGHDFVTAFWATAMLGLVELIDAVRGRLTRRDHTCTSR
ncbi:MAG: hypothetical protein ACREM3_05935 [Candidatus Rokuibacteriota bacterium]